MSDEPTEHELQSEDAIEPVKTEPAPPPPQMDGNGKSKTDTIGDQVRKAREMIPVDERGLRPETFAQWIDIAKDICKATLMLPEHLHHNAPVMAGILSIAARFRLDPYLLGSQTYVQNNRLCFQAQAFGAILYASGLLIGRLHFQFHGEGEEMTCTVSGRFRDDPDTIHSATTPTLKQLHPGHTQKDGKMFVRGSPLFDKDPEQQISYFAERRWIRRHAPDVCMGMFTREEVMDIDDYRVEREGGIPLSADRLGQLDTGEGWRDGAHVDLDLASIQPEPQPAEVDHEPEPPRPARKVAQPPKQPPGGGKPVRRKVAPIQVKTRPARPARPSQARPPTRAQVQAIARRAEKPPSKRDPAPSPRWFNYVTNTEEWIKTLTDEKAGTAEGRWEGERDERDKAQVPIGERSRLRALLDRKLAQLAPKEA